MRARTIAPYGTWVSPLSAERLAAGVTPLSAPRLVGGAVYWLEGLPAEGGRVVVVRARPGEPAQRQIPAPFNARTRVHEYGGGAYLAAGEVLYFSNFADNLVYARQGEGEPVAITQDGQQRHADFELDRLRRCLIAVREDHGMGGDEPVNSLVALGLDGQQRVLTSGYDFYAAPRLSPDGRHLAWLCWNHPQMPWNGSELWLADVASDGSLQRARKLAGSETESLCQPVWSPDGVLHAVSDRSGWWNLYRVVEGALMPLCPMEAEFGRPQWVFGQSMYGFASAHEIVASYIELGVSKLMRIDLRRGEWQPIATPYSDLQEISVGAGHVVALAGSPTQAAQVVSIEIATGEMTVLAQSLAEPPGVDYLSVPESLSYASTGGRLAHAFYYPPRNVDYQAVAAELPPLIVTSHGGPTSMASNSLKLGIQYWTSRGFAVLDVNYGGSTGYGRAYMDLLKGQWGVVDVDDCVAGARHLAAQGLVDVQRMAIRGGSASGYTTLSALTFHSLFKAGASYYGVSDLAALDADTHKFESRYTSYLIAPPPERERLYQQRSPILHADKLNCPMIFLQGLDDKVVLPAQSEVMVAALKARRVPVAYLPFEGEGHGFRRLETIRRAQEAELYFYAQVFGFEPADKIEPVAIQVGD
ncbi:dipeptidyl-peptidase 5 [Chitinimonas naiadis]